MDNYLYTVKMNNFGSYMYALFDQLDQANFICF